MTLKTLVWHYLTVVGGIFTGNYYRRDAKQVKFSGSVMFRRVRRVAKSTCWIRHAVRLSVRMYPTWRLPWNLLSWTSMKICWQNPNLIKSGQTYRTIYMGICGPGERSRFSDSLPDARSGDWNRGGRRIFRTSPDRSSFPPSLPTQSLFLGVKPSVPSVDLPVLLALRLKKK